MDYDQMFRICVEVFKKGGIYTEAASGIDYTEKYSVTDLTRQGQDTVVVKHNNKLAVTAYDTFSAVRWYLKIDQGEYTPGKMEDPFIVPNDKEVMAEQDAERILNNKWNYPHLERLYGR
jgi:hypothetical protein